MTRCHSSGSRDYITLTLDERLNTANCMASVVNLPRFCFRRDKASGNHPMPHARMGTGAHRLTGLVLCEIGDLESSEPHGSVAEKMSFEA